MAAPVRSSNNQPPFVGDEEIGPRFVGAVESASKDPKTLFPNENIPCTPGLAPKHVARKFTKYQAVLPRLQNVPYTISFLPSPPSQTMRDKLVGTYQERRFVTPRLQAPTQLERHAEEKSHGMEKPGDKQNQTIYGIPYRVGKSSSVNASQGNCHEMT